MTPFRDLPIRRKVALVILVTSTIVLLLTATAFMTYEWIAFRNDAVTNLTTLGRLVADNTTAALRFHDVADVRGTITTLRSDPDIVTVAVYDEDGRPVAFESSVRAKVPPFAELPASGHRFDAGELALCQRIVHENRLVGTLFIEMSLDAMERRFALYAGIVLLILITSTLVAFAISSTLQQRVTQPIQELAQTAHAITARGDYTMRATRYGNDELGALTDAFNRMLDEIKERDQRLSASEDQLRVALTETERRVDERTVELREANRELEAFSYSVSHDLRGPLRHMAGYAEIIREDPANQLSAEGQTHLTRIGSAAQRLTRLVDSLLNLSRVGRQELVRQPVRLDENVTVALRELEAEMQNRRVEVQREPLPTVDGDPSLLHLVFVNLLSNALKYTRPREVGKIAIGTTVKDGVRCVYVRDNGVGFDPQHQNKLFGVFERLHSAAEFEGTGVGLATVDRIIRRHGGKIWAESAVNEGATFYFSLPGM